VPKVIKFSENLTKVMTKTILTVFFRDTVYNLCISHLISLLCYVFRGSMLTSGALSSVVELMINNADVLFTDDSTTTYTTATTTAATITTTKKPTPPPVAGKQHSTTTTTTATTMTGPQNDMPRVERPHSECSSKHFITITTTSLCNSSGAEHSSNTPHKMVESRPQTAIERPHTEMDNRPHSDSCSNKLSITTTTAATATKTCSRRTDHGSNTSHKLVDSRPPHIGVERPHSEIDKPNSENRKSSITTTTTTTTTSSSSYSRPQTMTDSRPHTSAANERRGDKPGRPDKPPTLTGGSNSSSSSGSARRPPEKPPSKPLMPPTPSAKPHRLDRTSATQS